MIFLIILLTDKGSVTVNKNGEWLGAFDLIHKSLSRCADKAGTCNLSFISHIVLKGHSPV